MNRYAVYYKNSRTVVKAPSEHEAYQKVAVLFGIEPTNAHKACRAFFLREDSNVNQATGVATTPNTMSKKNATKKADDIGTKVARIARAQKAQKAEAKAAAKAAKPAKPSLADRVEKVAAPKAAKKAAASDGPLSGLSAAALVLREAKEPMKAKDIVAAIAKGGLGTNLKGKTPDATLYSAMMTEYKKKGKASRFIKDGALFSFNAESAK